MKKKNLLFLGSANSLPPTRNFHETKTTVSCFRDAVTQNGFSFCWKHIYCFPTSPFLFPESFAPQLLSLFLNHLWMGFFLLSILLSLPLTKDARVGKSHVSHFKGCSAAKWIPPLPPSLPPSLPPLFLPPSRQASSLFSYSSLEKQASHRLPLCCSLTCK